jgi:hypothetical protein
MKTASEQLDTLRVKVYLDRDTAEWLRGIVIEQQVLRVERAAANEALKVAIGEYDHMRNAYTRTVEYEVERKARRAAIVGADVPVTGKRCDARVPDPKGWYGSRCSRNATVTRPEFDDEGSANLCGAHRKSENTGRYRHR